MNKKLYVGNLLYEVTDEDLKNQFATAGTVVTATVIKFRDSGRSKGFGFVEMGTEDEAKKAIEMFHQQDFKGRMLVVSEARPPKENAVEQAAPMAPSEEQPQA
jgi:RNA recognition motif-containing protein